MTFRADLRALVLTFATTALAFSAGAQQTVMPLWPHGAPEPAQTTAPEADVTQPTDNLISGRRTQRLTNVTVPTLSVYSPHVHNNGAAALVFPGGGYIRLAWNGEGTDTCEWLNSLGMTCILVKYRVPETGLYPDNFADLEDAQQAMRLTRAHAAQWHIDSNRIGVVGFSAGGNLAALLCTHPDDHHVESTPAAKDVDATLDAHPNFAILAYPAYLAISPEQTVIDPVYMPNSFTPPTFLAAAENDKSYGRNALVYYRALMDASIPSSLHMFPGGGHGFGVYPLGAPEHWTDMAGYWLREIGVLPPLPLQHVAPGPATGQPVPGPTQPCTTVPTPPQPGRPDKAVIPDPPPCF